MSYLKQKLSIPLVKYSVFGHRLVLVGVRPGRSALLVRGDDEIPAVVAADGGGRLSSKLHAASPHFGTKTGPPGLYSGAIAESEQERAMFVPLLAVPLAAQLIAAADGVPKLNVTPSCKGAAKAGYIATTEDRLQELHRQRASHPRQLARTGRASRPAPGHSASRRSRASSRPTPSSRPAWR